MKRIDNLSIMIPTRVLFGDGVIHTIGDELTNIGNKPLIVTGSSSQRKMGNTDIIERQLREKKFSFEVFEEVEPNPSTVTVERGALIAKESKCDVVIGLGGGSVLDAGKAIAASAGLNRKIFDILDNGIFSEGLSFVAFLTTAGTGSEVTQVSVLSIEETKEKVALSSSYIFPRIAIVDPSLTIGLPKNLTATTGVDALSHAIEAYTSKSASWISDLFAIEAIKLIGKSLRKAVFSGEETIARNNMMMASTLAGIAIAHAGTGFAHGISMTIGGITGTSHGYIVGIALPKVIEFNLFTNSHKYGMIAKLLEENVNGLNHIATAKLSIHAVTTLLDDIQFPKKLSELGITKDMLDQFVADTKNRPVLNNNSRIPEVYDIRQMYEDLI